jgi:hypothetical protein
MSQAEPKQIGKIVEGENQLSYWVQIDNTMEGNPAPSPEDCGFGTFVRVISNRPPSDQGGSEAAIPSESYPELIGVIIDTQLQNKDLLRSGPRLSQNYDQMSVLFPDFIDERVKYVHIILIGHISNGVSNHNFPDITPHLGDTVLKMNEEEVKAFHLIDDHFRVGYYTSLLSAEPSLTKPLLMRIFNRLSKIFPEQKELLALLTSNLEFSMIMGGGLK